MTHREAPERPRLPAREIAFGALVAGGVLWLTFFASPAQVQVATLALVVGLLIWFGSVDPGRLLAPGGGLHPMLFGLTGLAVAVVATAAIVLGTATLFLVAALAAAGLVVGLVRGVRLIANPARHRN